MKNPPWLKDEIILVMDFYIDNSAKIPGKDSDEIAELSSLLNDFRNMHGLHGDAKFRNVNGVYMKIMNLKGLDERYDGIGLSSASNADREVWSSFKDDNIGLKSTAKRIRSYINSSGDKIYDIEHPIDNEIEQEYNQNGNLITLKCCKSSASQRSKRHLLLKISSIISKNCWNLIILHLLVNSQLGNC